MIDYHDFNKDTYKIFQERDVDKVIQLFEWFRPEDLYFISFVLWIILPIVSLLYLSPLRYDILFLFGNNGITGYYLNPVMYLLIFVILVPCLYLYIVNKFRKIHTSGYVGRKFYLALHCKIKRKFNPIKDKYLLNEDK